MDLKTDIAGRDVLIVEDIVDTGQTMDYLLRTFWAREPASLKVCTLLNKPNRRAVEVPLDYIGFDIPDEFVLGYGLDYDEKYRNLPYVGVLKRPYYDQSPQ
jgi:hypoxanthine phosphoribosyltransferase